MVPVASVYRSVRINVWMLSAASNQSQPIVFRYLWPPAAMIEGSMPEVADDEADEMHVTNIQFLCTNPVVDLRPDA